MVGCGLLGDVDLVGLVVPERCLTRWVSMSSFDLDVTEVDVLPFLLGRISDEVRLATVCRFAATLGSSADM